MDPYDILRNRVYELLLSDSSRVVTRTSREVIANSDRHKEHKAWKYNLEANRRRERGMSGTSSTRPTDEHHHELEKSSV